MRVHERRASGAARERLDSQRARAAVEVEDGSPGYVAENREKGLPDAVGGRPNRGRPPRRGRDAPPPELAGDYAQHLSGDSALDTIPGSRWSRRVEDSTGRLCMDPLRTLVAEAPPRGVHKRP